MIAARLALCLLPCASGVAFGQSDAPDLPGVVDVAPLPPRAGPPMAGFPENVGQCWVVGALSPEAQGIVVTLAVDLDDDGRPLADGIRLITSSSGSAQATEQAFQSARRAVLRCGQSDPGTQAMTDPLRRSLEITFDPSGPSSR